MKIRRRQGGGHIGDVIGRSISGRLCGSTKGVAGFRTSPHLPPLQKNSRRKGRFATGILLVRWLVDRLKLTWSKNQNYLVIYPIHLYIFLRTIHMYYNYDVTDGCMASHVLFVCRNNTIVCFLNVGTRRRIGKKGPPEVQNYIGKFEPPYGQFVRPP